MSKETKIEITEYDWDKMLAEHRKKHFKVNINKSLGNDECSISVTHNGSQYISIQVTRDEMKQVQKRITLFLKDGKIDER